MTTKNYDSIIETLRWVACSKMPWMGASIYKNTIKVEPTAYGTGATDGKNIFIDPQALEKWDRDSLTFLLLHEAWHSAMGHVERRGTRDAHLWNVVCDHVINWALSQPGLFGRLPQVEGKQIGILLDTSKYNPGETPEVLYALAVQETQKCPQHGQSGDDGDEGDQGQQGQGQGQGEGEGDDDEGDGQGQDQGQGKPSKNHKHGKSGKPCTCGFPHDPSPGKYGIGDDIRDSPITDPEEREKWRMEKEAEITRAIQEAAERGDVPGNFAEALGLGKPQIPWTVFIQQFCSNAINARTDYSMRRANSSLMRQGIYAPTLTKPSAHVVMILDTSGSVSSADLSNAVAEVFAASQAGAKVTVIECDTDVSQTRSFEPGTPPPTEFRIKGRGGTAFTPALKWLQDGKLGEDYDCVLYFTDGYGDNPSADVAPYKPMVWLTTAAKPAEWGIIINYDKNRR